MLSDADITSMLRTPKTLEGSIQRRDSKAAHFEVNARLKGDDGRRYPCVEAVMEVADIERALCPAICEAFTVTQLDDGTFAVDTEFYFPDGDAYSVYLEPRPFGLRLTDRGHTLMQLSYSMDVTALRSGNRKSLFERALGSRGAAEDEGELVIETQANDLAGALLRFAQLVTEVRALDFLNRVRVENTFFDDLRNIIGSVVDLEKVVEGYVVDGLPNAENYAVDFYVPGKALPLYLFGVTSRDKARLATIVLQHMSLHGHEFESIIVFQNQASIPSVELARLSNVGGEQIASLEARAELERKILKRAA